MLKIGLIGSGRMSKHHAHKLAKIKDVAITAVYSPTLENAKHLAQQYGASYYTDYHLLLENEELNVVYITTPILSHYQIASKVIDKGLDLFLEKPISLSLTEAINLAEAVKKKGIICTIGHMYRYKEIVQTMSDLLKDKPIALVNGYWYWTRPPIAHICNKDLSGGPVVDQMIHLVDLCRLFCGDIASVSALYTMRTRKEEDFNSWDGYTINLNFKNGIVGSLSGTLALFPEFTQQNLFDNPVIDIAAKNLLVRFTPQKVISLTTEKQEVFYSEKGEINEEFIKAVHTRNSALIKSDIEDNIKTLAIVLAANESAQKGCTIFIDEFIQRHAITTLP